MVWGQIFFGIVAVSAVAIATPAIPPTTMDLRNTDTGEPLDLSEAMEEGRDTNAVKKFFATGINPYTEDMSCMKIGRSLFLTSCSGCHGEIGEGKIGPGLNDDYWTYPKNMSDQGLFETIFGGARAQMGPHYGDLTLDQMLLVMAWTRHLYKDDIAHADWLTDEQKQKFKQFKPGETFADAPAGQCTGMPIPE
ncbi:cytochrome c(L), periplasmic [Labrys sp. WJW]|nr:cytochrome c(L), periplasmic [Labrys sp. WJW]